MNRQNEKLKYYSVSDLFVLQVRILMNDDKFYTTYVLATKHEDTYEELFSGLKVAPKEDNKVFDRLGLVNSYPLADVMRKEGMIWDRTVIDTSTLFKLILKIEIEDKCGELRF